MENEDWAALCAIYGGDNDLIREYGNEDVAQVQTTTEITALHHHPDSQNERQVRLVESKFPHGFCGTVYMTLSTAKVAFARRVDDRGNYRYFSLQRSPVLKLDFLYRQRNDGHHRRSNGGGDNTIPSENNIEENNFSCEGPSSLRLVWDYYPCEWPPGDQDEYRSCLSKKCHTILQGEGMAFAVCEFLEHHALSSYKRSSDFDDGWKNYVDPIHPDFQLVILPPERDRLYQPTIGILIHPQEEAVAIERNQKTAKKGINSKTKASSSTTSTTVTFVNALDFGRHALIHFWKDLYTTTCPICLDDSVLYSEGIVLPYCQHYSCHDCFQMYLKYKVQDLKQYRTNPFVCPVETCKRELPIVGYCKQHLSAEDMETVRNWYHDLKNPPCWSLDRCLSTKTCGAVGSMRRRRGALSTAKNKKSSSPSATSSYDAHLVYCEACQKTWCELCLKRIYDDDDVDDSSYGTVQQSRQTSNGHTITRSTPSNHRWNCQPQGVMKFCRRYMAASKEIQEKCQERYPWIQSYCLFCQHDGAALQYVLENGQRCPNCQTGVERIEGCFHMKCPTCATHFCYECGMELFPPYYGTHHCWEEQVEERNNHHLNATTDEQLAMALYLGQAM